MTFNVFSTRNVLSRLYYHIYNVILAKFFIDRNNSKMACHYILFIGLATLDLDSNCGRHDLSVGAKIRASGSRVSKLSGRLRLNSENR